MTQPLRALLLEDRETDAELVKRELRRSGFTGDWPRVQTEADFLAQLNEGLEIILADYEMPQFSALRALELLREHGRHIPLIIISGTIGEETAVSAMREGAVDYLLKDRLGRLGAAVRAALHLKAERDEKRSIAEALRESEARFRQMAEAIPDVFWLSDPETQRMLYVSPAYERIWGRSRESLYAAPRSFGEAIHPEDRHQLDEIMRAKEKGGGFDLVYRVVRPDSTIRWIHDSGFPIQGPAGAVYRVAGVARDITRQRELEAQLLQSQKMEAVGRLAGGVAHDFNNILTVINGYGESLQQTLPAQDPRREMVDEICGAGRRAAALTRQLLAFSRKQILDVQLMDLNTIVLDMEKLLRRLLGERVELKLSLGADLGRVRADRSQLEQVILNLAVNAGDAMPEGGQLHLSTQPVRSTDPLMASISHAGAPADFAMLSVRDTGMGMSAEVKAHIFEPFFTTKPEGKGTGLGLATCFGVVQQSGGHILVESRVGEGTTFRIFLPVSSSGAPEPQPVPLSHAPKGSETILLVEDNSSVLALTAKLLRTAGYDVLEAPDGNEGFQLALEREGRIDLLLTDAVMPRMSGRELVDRVRRQWPHIRALLCSGYVQDELSVDPEWLGGLAFLPKPYTSVELLQKVRAVLDAK